VIELITFFGSIWLLLAASILRDYWKARRDRLRRQEMDLIAVAYINRPVHDLVLAYGDPWEISEFDKRCLYIWKSPPATKLPTGSGLLILAADVNPNGVVDHIQWRDRVPTYP
jgi:hypothetical protein